MIRRGLNSVAFRLSRTWAAGWWRKRRLKQEIRQRLVARQLSFGRDVLLITTFCNQNIPSEIPDRQNEVIMSMLADRSDMIWIPIFTRLTVSHDQFLDAMLQEAFRHVEHVLILDVDAIPMCRKAIDHLWSEARAGALAGAEQCAAHLGATHNYISPAVTCLSRTVYRRLGSPSAAPDGENDVFERLSRIATQRGVPLSPLRVRRYIAEPSWPLADGRRFGIGTYYGVDGNDLFFHNFCSRKTQGAGLRHFHDACKAAAL